MKLPRALLYFHTLFDSVLRGDQEALAIFANLIDNHGTKVVFSLAERLQYPQKEQIYKLAMQHCLELISNIHVAQLSFGVPEPALALYPFLQGSLDPLPPPRRRRWKRFVIMSFVLLSAALTLKQKMIKK